ncbi:hypothetical protein EDB92DRAFT_1862764 [Lactarius akahatsu]|uniref:Uncharacterized protein n=1 Tax=Lactarius akahatsu TaxID=416441 RepID=A0AAD4LGS6_9AGAM|nr:hypothetical protein EDB92DRAFT_1862764 [Lactarius akahatsu]
MAAYILGPICSVYTGLHPDTDSAAIGGLWDPFSFPSCNVPGHRPDSAPHVHDDSAPCHLCSYSSRILLPLDDFHSAHQTIIESLRTPVTSSGPATAGTVRDIITLGKAGPHSAPDASISTPTLSSTSPPAVFAIQHNDNLLVPSDEPNLPSSAAYNPVLDNRLSTGVQPSSLSPMIRPHLSPSSQESRRPIVVTAAPGASPGPTSDLGVATEDDDSQKPGLRENKDALDPLSVNRVVHANTMPTLGLPSKPPSLPSVTGSNMAITGPSMWESDAERT